MMNNVRALFPKGSAGLPAPPDPRKVQIIDCEVPQGADAKNYSVSLSNLGSNNSLQLAEREDFMAMCWPSLWGSERAEGSATLREFGELLRSLVQTYRPANRWHLFLLSQVADAAWKLQRLRRLQAGVYDAQGEGVGKHGVPNRTSIALQYDEQIDRQMSALEKAIRIYKKA